MTERFPLPADVQASFERRWRAEAARATRPCGEGVGRGLTCEVRPARPFPRGFRCDRHAPTPAPPKPDPTRTLAALRLALIERVAAAREEA